MTTTIAPHLTPEQRILMALEAPFDQSLYEAVMASESISETPSTSTWSGGYDMGYEAAAGHAARIVAERPAVPQIPEDVGLITLEADEGWEVEFWYFDSNREEPDWVAHQGDYQSAKFLLASLVCEMHKLADYVSWDIYRDYQTGEWEAFARDAEEGDPSGRGAGPIKALAAAIAEVQS